MGNLISGIQHFVITIATIVIMVIVPFYKPSVNQNTTSKQEVQIKKEATSSANVLGASQTDSTNQKAVLNLKISSSPTANPTSPSTYIQAPQPTQNISSQSNTNNNVPGQQSSSQSTLPVVNNIYIIAPTQTPVPTAIPIPTSTPYPTSAPTSTPAPTQAQPSAPTLDNLTRAQMQAQIDSIRGGQTIKLADLKPQMSAWLNTFNLPPGYPLSKDFMVNHILDDLQNYQGVVQ